MELKLYLTIYLIGGEGGDREEDTCEYFMKGARVDKALLFA